MVGHAACEAQLGGVGLLAAGERREEGRACGEGRGDGEHVVDLVKDRTKQNELANVDVDRQPRKMQPKGGELLALLAALLGGRHHREGLDVDEILDGARDGLGLGRLDERSAHGRGGLIVVE